LAQTLGEIDIEQPLPPMWAEFGALARVPLLVIRGGNSDILSAETVTSMKERHPAMDIIEVPDQGHVPVLAGADLLNSIAAFVAKCDAAAKWTGPEPKGATSDPQAAPAERWGQSWQ
jgi:pimeloyl-ACP methyl ester carboxylesterase